MASCDNPNVEKDALMLKRPKFDGKTKICVKCKENAGNVVVRYAVYCKSCFFSLVQTRFRKTLEPSINPVPDGPRRKALRAAGSLLVGYSGGTGSTTVLDLVAKTYFVPRPTQDEGPADSEDKKEKQKLKGGKEHPRNKERGVWEGRPAVCYVEVCGAFPGGKDRTEEIWSTVKGYPSDPFDFIPLRLEHAFDPQWWWSNVGGDLPSASAFLGIDLRDEDLRLGSESSSSSSPNPNSPVDALRRYLSSIPTQTAFHSAIQTLTRLLLLHTAASRNCSHLVLGTSLTSLSINLISGIAQGAGFSVAEEAKEEWDPRPERGIPVRVVRPLRDVGMKECAIWAWWCKLDVVGGSPRLEGHGKSSIATLTRDFIVGLETDYPATVSTIARTCAKLAPKEGSDGACVLCERPAQHGVQAWKASISIRAYQDAAFAVLGNTRPPHLTEEEIEGLTKRSTESVRPEDSLAPHLCYACHTTLTSRSSRGSSAPLPQGQSLHDVPLPMWVRSTLSATIRAPDPTPGKPRVPLTKEQLKAQIQDFLISDD